MADEANPVELPDELVIPLRKPISLGDLNFSEIRLREPTAGEIEQWDHFTGMKADQKAVSIMSGIPEQVVKQIPAREFYKAARFLGSFLG